MGGSRACLQVPNTGRRDAERHSQPGCAHPDDSLLTRQKATLFDLLKLPGRFWESEEPVCAGATGQTAAFFILLTNGSPSVFLVSIEYRVLSQTGDSSAGHSSVALQRHADRGVRCPPEPAAASAPPPAA